MKLIKLKPDKSTIVAFSTGVLIIILSIAMGLFSDTGMKIIFRDILMMYAVGFCFPLLYVKKNEPQRYEAIGITKLRLKRSIFLDVLFAILLLSIFFVTAKNQVSFNCKSLFAITYILVAGVFEMVCIYGFMRYYFEKAFGVIPAILLTALFYSLHHVGFQPEFFKLFFVGIMYCAVFYITLNIFILFPFFWGVGAIWDVLINSTAGKTLQNVTSFIVAICLLGAMVIFALTLKKGNLNLHGRKNKIEK